MGKGKECDFQKDDGKSDQSNWNNPRNILTIHHDTGKMPNKRSMRTYEITMDWLKIDTYLLYVKIFHELISSFTKE